MTAAYWRRQPEAGTEWGPGSTCWSDIHWSDFRRFRDNPSIGRTSHLLCACPAGPLSPPSSPPPSPPSSPPPPLLPPPDLTPVIIGAAGGGTVAILGVVIIIGVFYHCKCCKKKKPAAAADVRYRRGTPPGLTPPHSRRACGGGRSRWLRVPPACPSRRRWTIPLCRVIPSAEPSSARSAASLSKRERPFALIAGPAYYVRL